MAMSATVSDARSSVREVRTSMPAAAWWTVCIALTVLFLYPIWVMVTQAFKSPSEAGRVPPTLLPHSLSLHNYRGLSSVGGVNIFSNALNSAEVAIGTTIAVVILSALCGFALARLRFPGSSVVFFAILATFMIPFQAVITPLYTELRNLQLNNSLLGLGLVYTTFNLPLGVFVMRNTFAAIPTDIHEAAMTDGCGIIRALRHVILPLALPGLITTALLTFFTVWNEFFAALILISDQSKFTLPVVLTLISTGLFGSINWGLLQAGVVLTVIPCIALYVPLQRYYVSGLLSGAVK